MAKRRFKMHSTEDLKPKPKTPLKSPKRKFVIVVRDKNKKK
jgi:hypothetical protein